MKDKGFQLKSNKHTHLLTCEEVVKKTSRSSDLFMSAFIKGVNLSEKIHFWAQNNQIWP